MLFEQEFNLTFGEKYRDLQLKEVVVKKREGVCTITFLYPSTKPELEPANKKEIIEWARSLLQMEQLDVRVKFLRVFVEEKLILKSILKFFEENHKIVMTSLDKHNIKIEITNIDVLIKIKLNQRLDKYFAENRIVPQLEAFLEGNFLVNFVVETEVDETLSNEVNLDEVEIVATFQPTKRYSVEIVKEIIGKDILTQPEYINFITDEKKSVILAGFINKFERREFIRKQGKYEGQPKTYFTFTLDDEKGKIDCIYFSSKTNVQVMESLEDLMYVVVFGDVEKSKFTNKLQLKVQKMALATKEIDFPQETKEYVGGTNHGVVKIEKISSTSQTNMFANTIEYNDIVAGKNIIVFDIETTGLDLSNDEIIELGAVKVVDGKIKEKFNTLVKPTKEKITYEVTKLTGITEDMVKNAPTADVVLREFYDFAKDCILCGHNAIGFDLIILKRMAREFGIEFKNDVIDTLNLARQSHILVKNFKLGTIVKYLGLTLEGAHRAWNDAYATAEVLLKLCEKK